MKETRIVRRVSEAIDLYGSAFVPTMGALHTGHEKLIRSASETGLPVVVSIFVNPKQFGPNEDFGSYPRTLDSDFDICRNLNVSAVFIPDEGEIYPADFSPVNWPGTRDRKMLIDSMCGRHRPGHFKGVVTVVARLFEILRPKSAWFGWKDAQQFIILSKMAEDIHMGVELHAVETVRESDGLACSSRNTYLSMEQRLKAKALYEALTEAWKRGGLSGEIKATVQAQISESGLDPEYVELRWLDGLGEVPAGTDVESTTVPMILAAAAYCGNTRLIDNVRRHDLGS